MQRGGRSYRGRGGRGAYRGGNHAGAVKLKGLFERGVWYCNCEPRMPAEHFKVRKDGPNHGRWFYTCQTKDPKSCSFFLWDEEAQPRMESAVLNNSTSEPAAHAPNQPSHTAGPHTPTKPNNSAKRKLPWKQDTGYDTEDSDAEIYPWQPTAEESQALSQATDDAVAQAGARKVVKIEEFSTPGGAARKGGGAGGLMTPETTVERQPAAGRKTLEPVTPTPARYTDVMIKREEEAEADISPGLGGKSPMTPQCEDGLTATVFNILKSARVNLDSQTAGNLQTVLERHEMQKAGVEKGREIARLALKSRDATIVYQAEKIMSLENELEASRALVRHLRDR